VGPVPTWIANQITQSWAAFCSEWHLIHELRSRSPRAIEADMHERRATAGRVSRHLEASSAGGVHVGLVSNRATAVVSGTLEASRNAAVQAYESCNSAT